MKADRRELVRGMIAAGVVSALPATAFAKSGSRSAKPNILFIMADDLGFADLSCTGSSHIRTPNIDRIARAGVLLRQGYANSAICSPTRTALLSGCYQQRFEVGLWEPITSAAPDDIGLPFDRATIASVLRDIGYSTHLVGKWHLGSPPEHGPLAYGYDSFFGIVEGAADYFTHKLYLHGGPTGIGLAEGDRAIERAGYLTDLFGDEALKVVEGAGDKPFFLSLHFTAPHWPWEGREDAEMAKMLGSSRHHDGGNLAKYKEIVEAMDDNVGRVLAALERTGQLGNTIVVFTSDNGGERFSQTWPFTGVKGELLEGGIRVPILVRWPGRIPAGSGSEQVMTSMDFLPTLLAMAGGNPARAGKFDGADLSNQLCGRAAPVKRAICWRYKANDQSAIRDGDYKYLKIGEREYLFDLAADERERADIKQRMPEKLAELKASWASWNAGMLAYSQGSYSEDNKAFYPDRY